MQRSTTRTLAILSAGLMAKAVGAAVPGATEPVLDPDLWVFGIAALMAVRIVAFAQLDRP